MPAPALRLPTLRAALAAAVLLLLLDALWIGSMLPLYRAMVRSVQQGLPMRAVRLPYAVASYACLLVLLVVFALPLGRAWGPGAPFLLGGLTYGIYNATNGATFADYPLATALLDTAWGATAMGTTAYVVNQGLAL
jgi:uncharacterized membrane protein